MPEIVRGNPTNTPTQKPVKTHSRFKPDYSNYQTMLYGLNTPHFAMAGVADDDISVRVSPDLDTYSLKAPVMQPLKRNMDYFQLPLRALMPNSAELLITNPLQGEDVDADSVQCGICPTASSLSSGKTLGDIATALVSLLNTNLGTVNDWTVALKRLLTSIQFIDMFQSRGSLLANLGIDLGNPFKFKKTDTDSVVTRISMDDFVDEFFSFLASNISEFTVVCSKLECTYDSAGIPTFTIPGYRYYQVTTSGDADSAHRNGYITLDEFATVLHTEFMPISSVTSITWQDTTPTKMVASDGSTFSVTLTGYYSSLVKNLLRPLAYQLACAEFYTNDKIDAVYSAKLWHANQNALARFNANSSSEAQDFFVNGVAVNYDSCSRHYIDCALVNLYYYLNGSGASTPAYACGYAYFHNLLSYTRSLRYEDYFVGSRAYPLAVGDVSVNVTDNTVDIIDVSKNIQVQRFLNQVNRVGRKFSDYVKGILGDKPMKDVHEPIFLGHIADSIGAEETENTGSDQLSQSQTVTSKFRNNASRFAFEVHVSEPSILIGITNYELPRAYSRGNDREVYHIDRFDAFNPFMQFVGDQEIYLDEFNPDSSNADNAFGYQVRYAEYRQRVNRATGGFAEGKLPGYAFIVAPTDLSSPGQTDAPTSISSDFLRSKVSDIDQFYVSLTGYSLCSRFHFIVRNDISVSANRPMAFSPSIL